jgi:hypothetical protein
MVTLLRAFCRKCCRTAETADMAKAVLIGSSSLPVAAPEVFVEIERSSGSGRRRSRGRLGDGGDFDASDVDVNLVGLGLRCLGAACGFRPSGSDCCRGGHCVARLQFGRSLQAGSHQRLVRTGWDRLSCSCWFRGLERRIFQS